MRARLVPGSCDKEIVQVAGAIPDDEIAQLIALMRQNLFDKVGLDGPFL
jgi:hypothetical protein